MPPARIDVGSRDNLPGHTRHRPSPLAAGSPLSAREREILALMARGHRNGEIARRLFISVRTAGSHVSNILRKLNAANRVEAVLIGLRQGIV